MNQIGVRRILSICVILIGLNFLFWYYMERQQMKIDPKELSLTSDQLNKTHYCSAHAKQMGSNQKVISYCIFGNFLVYGSHFSSILESAKLLYPGWNVRVYTEEQNCDASFMALLKNHSNLFICDVAQLPGRPYDIRHVDPRLWRMAALADEQVDVVLFRDIDAVLLPREVAAVDEFLSSGKTLHLMRDHHGQFVPILAGMFGVRQTDANRKKLDHIRHILFTKGTIELNRKHFGGFDQEILQAHLLPPLAKSSLTHDSYHCKRYKGTVPFPTRRDGKLFIGNRRYRPDKPNDSVWKPCPVACRPKNHTDWEYC